MTNRQVFEFEFTNDVVIVIPHGPFMEFRDSDIRDAYNETYRLLGESGMRHLLVDFSEFDYFGSTFVGILFRLSKKARSNNGETALCHLSNTMRDMLKNLMLLENPKIDFALTLFPTRDAAIQHLSDVSERLQGNEPGN